MAASYTKKIVDAIKKKTAHAMEKSENKTLVLAGGVAANSHLRSALEDLCKKNKYELVIPPLRLCGDNAAMVATAGYFEYLKGNFADTSLNASACDNITVSK